jgi:hypothetical protein
MKIAIATALFAACLLTPALNAQVSRVDQFQPMNAGVERLTLIHGPGLSSPPCAPVPGQRWTTVKRGEGTLTLGSSDSPGAPKATGTLHLQKSSANVSPETLRSHPNFPALDTSLGTRQWSGTLQIKRE